MRWPWAKRREPVGVTAEDWYALLRMGTRLSLSEVLALDEASRAALYRASAKLDLDRFTMLAALIRRGEEAYPDVSFDVDGGAAKEASLLEEALAMAHKTMGTVIEL